MLAAKKRHILRKFAENRMRKWGRTVVSWDFRKMWAEWNLREKTGGNVWRFRKKQYLCKRNRYVSYMGLTGFDGKTKWYVSTRSDGCRLHNLFGRKINWQQ